jgi:predicted DNA-binding ribbon-helix-helix protein
MRLEPEVWDALREICIREGVELRDLIKEVEKTAAPGGRTSAVRVHVLQYFRAAATNEGHVVAGHGTKTITGQIRLPAELDAASLPLAQDGEGGSLPLAREVKSAPLPVIADVDGAALEV